MSNVRPLRICKKCRKKKPHHAFGLCGYCYVQYWEERNPEKAKTIEQNYSIRHRVELNEKAKRYYIENKEKVLTYQKVYREQNPQKIKMRDKRYRKSHGNEIKTKQHEWYEANKEDVIARVAQWAAENPEKARDYKSKWNIANPDKRKINCQRRLARKKNLPCDFTDEDWQEILEEFNYSCVYCGRNDVPMTQDHKIPLSRGGPYVKANILPACLSCNSKKNTKTYEEYLRFIQT